MPPLADVTVRVPGAPLEAVAHARPCSRALMRHTTSLSRPLGSKTRSTPGPSGSLRLPSLGVPHLEAVQRQPPATPQCILSSHAGPSALGVQPRTESAAQEEARARNLAAADSCARAAPRGRPFWATAAVLLLLVGAVCVFLHPWPAWASGTHLSGAPASAGGASSVATSSAGFRVARWLRGATGGSLPDAAIVALVAALPVVELRGAIPVAFWLGFPPLQGALLAVLGNMVPVPFILLGLGPLQRALSSWSPRARAALEWFLDYTRRKADPIAEFQALGLMLFVAVPLPGTGAWSGAIAAHILKLPFWDAFWANFFGVVLAGAIVTTLCVLGLREALLLAAVLFALSCVMWSGLRRVLQAK